MERRKRRSSSIRTKNSFSELVNRDDDGTLTEMKPKYREPLKVKIQDAVKAPSRNQEKKKRRQGKHTTMEDVNDKSLRDQVMDFVNNPYKMTDEKKKPGIRLFSEVVKADSFEVTEPVNFPALHFLFNIIVHGVHRADETVHNHKKHSISEFNW